MKPVRFSGHALDQMRFRGASEREVREAIETAPWEPAKEGRWECRREYPFGGVWNGRIYNTKMVRPIFAEGEDEIIVVTVYVYYY